MGRVQRVDADVRRAALAEQRADGAQVGEVADAEVAFGAQGVQLKGNAPCAPGRRERALRDDDQVHGRARVRVDVEGQLVNAQRHLDVERDAPRVEGRSAARVGHDDRRVAQRQRALGRGSVFAHQRPAQGFGPAHRRQRDLEDDRLAFTHDLRGGDEVAVVVHQKRFEARHRFGRDGAFVPQRVDVRARDQAHRARPANTASEREIIGKTRTSSPWTSRC